MLSACPAAESGCMLLARLRNDSRRPPIIEPVVARAAVFLRPSPHDEVADQRLRPGLAVDAWPCLRAEAFWACAVRWRRAPLVGAQRLRRIVDVFAEAWRPAPRRPRSPYAAPCARNGSIGWAASPISVTGPLPPRNGRLAVEQRPLEPSLADRDQVAAPSRPRTSARNGAAFPRGSPARVQPASLPFVVHDGDHVDEAAAFHRIVHEMGIEPEPQMHHRLAPFRRDVLRPAPARATRCGGGTPVGRVGAAARAPLDHMPSAPINASACSSSDLAGAARQDADAIAVRGEILDAGRRA